MQGELAGLYINDMKDSSGRASDLLEGHICSNCKKLAIDPKSCDECNWPICIYCWKKTTNRVCQGNGGRCQQPFTAAFQNPQQAVKKRLATIKFKCVYEH